ncbi:MAG: molecular chaperone TorD family protein [Methylophaga sp.]|nr:molecular chaperone TorD family protein [Methylophaga sp.]
MTTMTQTNSEFDTDNEWRAQTYALLANLLYRAPDAQLLEALAALEVTEPDSPLAASWQALSESASNTEAQQLEKEYQQLFIGLIQGELIPYGSYYQTGFLNEKPLAVLRGDLAKLGLARQQDSAEPEDHISAECDVMRLILLANGVPVVDEQQFFNRHLKPWVSRFFIDLQQAKSASFYQAVGMLGERFIKMETERLAEKSH